MARTCYYTNEGFAEEVNGQVVYHLAKIEEGSPGYTVMYSDADLDVVLNMAQVGNETAGLSESDVRDIVTSSMAAGRVSR